MRRSRATAVLETRIYRHLHGLHVRAHLVHRKRLEAGSNKGRRTGGGSLVEDLIKGKKDFSIPACSSSFAWDSTAVKRGTRCQCGRSSRNGGPVELALTPDFNGISLASAP